MDWAYHLKDATGEAAVMLAAALASVLVGGWLMMMDYTDRYRDAVEIRSCVLLALMAIGGLAAWWCS